MGFDRGGMPLLEGVEFMKRRSMIVAGALVLAFAIPGAGLAAAPTSPFTGSWEATDIPDGSHETLVVSTGSRPSVIFQDFYASGCDTYSNLPADHFTAAGKGEVDGTRLWIEYRKSGCGTFLLGGYGDYYDYFAGSDTLVGSDGIVWTRTQ